MVNGTITLFFSIINANAEKNSELVVLKQYQGCQQYNYSVLAFSGSAAQLLSKDK